MFAWLEEYGDVNFEDHVKAYVDSKSHRERMVCLKDTRITHFYELLLDLEIKSYHSTQAHSKLLSRMDNLTIPDEFDYCETLQQYATEVATIERSKKVGLRRTLRQAQELVDHVKQAAQQKILNNEVLQILVSKIRRLQEHFRDAFVAFGESPRDLLDEALDNWW